MDAKTWNSLTERDRFEKLELVGAGVCRIPAEHIGKDFDELDEPIRRALGWTPPEKAAKLAAKKGRRGRRN